ncbi:MAG: phage tail protein [Chitinivibrionia bacterium]|nr:phage tail protein [Chitinivibrionia bacterium]
MSQPSIRIDRAQLADVKATFAGVGNIAPKVISRSINRALDGVKTDGSRLVNQQITAKVSVIKKSFTMSRATVNRLTGTASSSGKPLPLIEFSFRQTKKGVTIQIFRNKARKLIPGAFITTVKNGHSGVFWRVYHETKKPVRPKVSYGRLPKKYRLPMKELFGPRTPDILSPP